MIVQKNKNYPKRAVQFLALSIVLYLLTGLAYVGKVAMKPVYDSNGEVVINDNGQVQKEVLHYRTLTMNWQSSIFAFLGMVSLGYSAFLIYKAIVERKAVAVADQSSHVNGNRNNET